MSELKIQVLSDLHLEFPHAWSMLKRIHNVPVLADILVLAGDIGIPESGKRDLEGYLEDVSKKYKLVLYVLTKKDVEKICGKYENVILMEKKSLVRENVRFVGCTLWSLVPEERKSDVERGLNDYNHIMIEFPGEIIRNLRVKDTLKFFHEEKAFIQREVEIAKEKKQKVVVITHHAPFIGASHPRFYTSKINTAFCSDLEEMIKDPIICWIWGHTHYSNTSKNINGVPCVSNQLGYITMREECGFKPKSNNFEAGEGR